MLKRRCLVEISHNAAFLVGHAGVGVNHRRPLTLHRQLGLLTVKPLKKLFALVKVNSPMNTISEYMGGNLSTTYTQSTISFLQSDKVLDQKEAVAFIGGQQSGGCPRSSAHTWSRSPDPRSQPASQVQTSSGWHSGQSQAAGASKSQLC